MNGPASDSLTPSELSWPDEKPSPPEISLVSRKITTLAAIRKRVTQGSLGWVKEARRITRGLPEHSGHRIPTAAWVMHSGQTLRPQLEQLSAVSRSGCR